MSKKEFQPMATDWLQRKLDRILAKKEQMEAQLTTCKPSELYEIRLAIIYCDNLTIGVLIDNFEYKNKDWNRE